MHFMKNFFIKIASLLGLELQEKQQITTDYTQINQDIPVTMIIANKISSLALMDSDIKVVGDKENATYLDELLQSYLFERLSVACEVALGTGDCLLKPFTDGTTIGVDIIQNYDFMIMESIGDLIKSIIIKVAEFKQNNSTFTRFEIQQIKEINNKKYLIIKQLAFKNDKQIPLSSVKSWEHIQETTVIENVNQLLLGRIKCPTINRNDINGVNGVSITFGNEHIIKNITNAYNRFNQEFENKEAFIFASKTLFYNDHNGKPTLPTGKDRLFMNIKPVGDDANLIHEYSPDIRVDALERGFELNLKLLETACGLSAGILTPPHTNFATATEMKANIQSTFAYITKFRYFIENGVVGLINAVSILLQVNELKEIGDFKIEFDWSTSFVEQLTEQFNRLMQAEAIGAVDKAEIRQFVISEDYQTAKEKVEEIAKRSMIDEEI